MFETKKDARWDLDNPTIKILEDAPPKSSEKISEDNLDPISVMTLVDGMDKSGVQYVIEYFLFLPVPLIFK